MAEPQKWQIAQCVFDQQRIASTSFIGLRSEQHYCQKNKTDFGLFLTFPLTMHR
jgi:hypothetical protein